MLVICLVTACGNTSTTDRPAEKTESVWETSEEPDSEAGKSSSAEEKLVSETAELASEISEPASETAEPVVPEVAESVLEPAESVTENTEVILGDEQFEEFLPLLEGKRVALFTNQTGIVGDEVF